MRVGPFDEKQRFAGWVYVLVGTLSLGAWAVFGLQVIGGAPVGNNPGPDWMVWLLLALFGVLFPLFLYALKLHVRAEHDGVRIRFAPFVNRLILFRDIASAEACTYRPVADYGGWGVRGLGKKRAYNARGNEGVLLRLRDGVTVMIGSQRAAELQDEIRRHLR